MDNWGFNNNNNNSNNNNNNWGSGFNNPPNQNPPMNMGGWGNNNSNGPNNMPMNMPPNQQQQQQFQQPPTPQKQRLSITLQNNERGYYSAMLQQADKNDTQKVSGKDAVEFFMRSGVDKGVLRNIWEIASYNGEYLDRDEFYVALRLIAYAQNGINVSAQSIQSNIPVALPKIGPKPQQQQQQQNLNQSQQSDNTENSEAQKKPATLEEITKNMMEDYNKSKPPTQQVQLNQSQSQSSQHQQQQLNNSQTSNMSQQKQVQDEFSLGQDMIQKYTQYFKMTDTQNQGKISGAQAKPIFSRSNLDKETLGKIWQMSDQQNTGFLTLNQFIVALHLIYMKGKGHEIPNQLPQSLKQFLNNGGVQQQSNNFQAFDGVQTALSQKVNSTTNSETSQKNFNFPQNHNPQQNDINNSQVQQQDFSGFNNQQAELNGQIQNAQTKLSEVNHNVQDKIVYVKELHSIIISEKRSELTLINGLIEAQEKLCNLIEEENNSLKKEMQDLEQLKDSAMEKLVMLGQRAWEAGNNSQQLHKDIISTASNAINEITDASQKAISRGNSGANNQHQQQQQQHQQQTNNNSSNQWGEGGFGNTSTNNNNDNFGW